MVEQWNRDSGTVEQWTVMVEQLNIGREIVEQ